MPEEHDDKIPMVKLKGEVRGFVGDSYTRNIHPAKVYVRIVIPNDKKKYYSPYDKNDMVELMERFPDLYRRLYESKTIFHVMADEEGGFELAVPASSWKYIVCAHVEDKDYAHTSKMGNDGLGGHDEIGPAHFNKSEHSTIDGIILPVEDKWWKESEGRHKNDDKKKPKVTTPGIVSKERFEEIEEALKEQEKSGTATRKEE